MMCVCVRACVCVCALLRVTSRMLVRCMGVVMACALLASPRDLPNFLLYTAVISPSLSMPV